jgi:hypothetical protein
MNIKCFKKEEKMRRVKIIIQGDGIAICLGQWEVIKRIKNMNPTTWADQAYQGSGYVGFNLETGRIGEHPGPTTIKLYEIPKNNEFYLQDLRNHLWQNRQRVQKEIEERLKSFYTQNCQIT